MSYPIKFLLLQWMTAGLMAVTLFSMLGKTWWVFDLFCHFRLQYCIFLTVLLVAFTVCRSGRWAAIAALVLGLNLYPIAISYFAPVSATSHGSPLKVISLNVYSGNSQHQKVIDFIDHEDPDVFFLFEFTPEWEKQLHSLKEKYPYSFKHAQPGNFGLACFSKHSLKDATLKELSPDNYALFVEIEHEGSPVLLVGAHPYPPSGSYPSKLRNQQLKQLNNYLAEESRPKIVVGDLNITPWSPHFQKFLSEANLFDSRSSFGIQTTWPSQYPPFLRIPIDHCLLSKEFSVIDRRVGSNVGSDHLPVIITVALKQ